MKKENVKDLKIAVIVILCFAAAMFSMAGGQKLITGCWVWEQESPGFEIYEFGNYSCEQLEKIINLKLNIPIIRNVSRTYCREEVIYEWVYEHYNVKEIYKRDCFDSQNTGGKNNGRK